jgi:hypothetical protein
VARIVADYEREYINGAAQSFGDVFARASAPHRLINPHPNVAVLTDGSVSSAGEAIAIYFRGRPGTRSFGLPTCGHHHLLQEFPIGTATLRLVTAEHADRTKERYRGPIVPEEFVTSPEETLQRAVAWLLGAWRSFVRAP